MEKLNPKIHNKKWKIDNVSKKHSLSELLEQWKRTIIKEVKLRKKAMKSLSDFKQWYFTRNTLIELRQKVFVIYDNYRKEKQPTDEQKDFVEEKNRIEHETNSLFDDEKLPFVNRMMIENMQKIKRFLKDKELAKYKLKIELDFFKHKDHFLDKKANTIANWLGDISSYMEIYNGLWQDRTFGDVFDKDGKIVDYGTWEEAYHSSDSKIRETAWAAHTLFARQHRNSLLNLMFYTAKKMDKMAALHKYRNEVEWKAQEFYDITLKEYLYIIDQFVKFAKPYQKWFQAHAEIIKNAYELQSYEPWDYDLALKDIYEEIDDDKAKEYILSSLQCLGEEYCNKVQEIFNKPIINWTKTNATPNGYCISGASHLDEAPIHINWNGTTQSAVTLSHELGHNLKLHYAKLNNQVVTGSNKIIEELPSIVNEFLTMLYLIDKYKKEKKNTFVYGVYHDLFRYFFDCVCDSALTAHFGTAFVGNCIAKKPINCDNVEKLYIRMRGRCLGITKQQQNLEIKKWPYLNEKFNAYGYYLNIEESGNSNLLGYALGNAIGLIVATKIYNGDKNMLKKYLAFLKTTRTTDAFNGFKILGINLQKPDIYTESKQLINKYLDDFIDLIKIK